MARMSRAAMVMAAMAITGCQTEPAPIARDPVAVKPSPSASPTVQPVEADAGLVDDQGSPVAEYGAPSPPPKPKPSVGSGMGAAAPMYGMPPPHIK